MNLLRIVFIVAFFFTAVGANAQEHGHAQQGHRIDTVQVGDPLEGKHLFQQKSCIACHAIKGVGADVGPDLGRLKHAHNIYQMAGIMWNHAVQMQQAMDKRGIKRPEFRGGEMADLIAYLHSLEVVGDPEKGQLVFSVKGCAQCHAVNGKGGKIGPELARTMHPHPPIELAGMMWNHSPEMTALMHTMKIPRPVFEENEMADLLAYLDLVQRRAAQAAEPQRKHGH